MRRTTALAMIALLLTGITACSPRPVDPHPTATHPEVATPGPAETTGPAALIPSFVVINAHSVSVGATTQEVIVDVPFTTDAATAVDLLAEAMDLEPTVSTIEATGCSPAATNWDFGGVRILAPAPDGSRLGVAFIARATAAETPNGLHIDLTFADQVGSSLADVVAHGPGGAYTVVSEDLGGGHGVAMLDGQDGNTWGVIMVVESGIVTSFYSPGYFASDDPTC
ncbi:MAG: hypothetical protein ABIQ01_11650 [Pseudolysinimonas sp.]